MDRAINTDINLNRLISFSKLAWWLGGILFVVSFFLPTPVDMRSEPANGFGLFLLAAFATMKSALGIRVLFSNPSLVELLVEFAALSVLGNVPTLLLIIHGLIGDTGRLGGVATWQVFAVAHAVFVGFVPPFQTAHLGTPYVVWVLSLWLVACYAMLFEFICWRRLKFHDP